MDDIRFLRNKTKQAIKRSLKRVAQGVGYDIVKFHSDPVSAPTFPQDFTPQHISIVQQVEPYTLTSAASIYSLIEAISYIVRQNIPGGIVECGVWRGGSMMAAALTLCSLNCQDRDLYLFDTYEGMTRPQAVDVHVSGSQAITEFEQVQTGEDSAAICYASLDDVKSAMARTNYNSDRIHFIKGKVEETLPSQAPDQISLLRLDTDFYQSTHHELEHLFPRLSPGGILIIDDYGTWQGARKAVDEYMEKYAPSLFLNRVDNTVRLMIKTGHV